MAPGLARVSGSGRLGALPVALLLLCCLVWGLNQVAIKMSGAGVSPLMGAGLRSLVAAALVWLWCGIRGEPLFRRDGTGAYGLLIGLLFAAEVALIYWGLAFTTASRSVIFLYMDGGVSQVDSFDPKPRLTAEHGQPFKMKIETTQFENNGSTFGSPFEFKQHGDSGIPVSSLFPHIAQHVDDLCVIRSMKPDLPPWSKT